MTHKFSARGMLIMNWRDEALEMVAAHELAHRVKVLVSCAAGTTRHHPIAFYQRWYDRVEPNVTAAATITTPSV